MIRFALNKIFFLILMVGSTILLGHPKKAYWVYDIFRKPYSYYCSIINMLYMKLKIPKVYGFISISIETAINCNLNCRYCMNEINKIGVISRPPFLSWDLFIKIIETAPPTVETIVFGGIGEPLLHPLIIDMINYASSKNKRVCMYTNGTLLKGEMLDRIAKSKLSVLNISIEPDAESCEYYRNINYNEITNNINTLISKTNNILVNFSLVMHKDYYSKINEFENKWINIINNIKSIPLLEFQEHLIKPNKETIFEFYRGNLDINTSGNISPCCYDVFEDYVIGNVLNSDLLTLDKNNKINDMLRGLFSGKTLLRYNFIHYKNKTNH